MKKFFYMSVLVLMAALTLTSCGSDDDKDKPDEPVGFKSITYNPAFEFSKDLIDVADVTVSYKDGDGKTVTETVKSTTWSKTVTIKKVPVTVGVKCDFKLKDGIQMTKEKYDFIALLVHNVSVDGVLKGFKDPNTISLSYGVGPDKFKELLTKRTGQIFGYDIHANTDVYTNNNVQF